MYLLKLNRKKYSDWLSYVLNAVNKLHEFNLIFRKPSYVNIIIASAASECPEVDYKLI